MMQTVDKRTLVRWRTAIFAIFLASGLSIATWASRVPQIKVALGIDNAQIGLLLLMGGAASILGLSISSIVLARFGARAGMFASMIIFGAGLVVIGAGADLFHSFAVVAIGLMLWGFGNGAVDVMMNVEGATIEKQSSRTLLPLFHAFFSFGTVIGAGLGFLAIRIGFAPVVHLAVMGVAIWILAIVCAASVPTHSPVDPEPGEKSHWRERLALSHSAWREPRTYALGVIMLGMSFAEGGANDWLPLSVVEGHAAPEELGAAGLATFSTAMTIVRVLGGPLVDRFGRVWVLRILAVTAASGLLLFIFAPDLPLVFVGAALWGAGVSLGFPLGMSAAADDPAKAAARVSAAAMIGYVAFLAGPPLLGLISEQFGLLQTLLILVVLIVLSGLFSGAARPIAGSKVGAGHH